LLRTVLLLLFLLFLQASCLLDKYTTTWATPPAWELCFYEICVQFFCIPVFDSFGYMSNVEILGHVMTLYLTFLRNHLTDFYSDCIILQSYFP
jgi:hypothetical protein